MLSTADNFDGDTDGFTTAAKLLPTFSVRAIHLAFFIAIEGAAPARLDPKIVSVILLYLLSNRRFAPIIAVVLVV